MTKRFIIICLLSLSASLVYGSMSVRIEKKYENILLLYTGSTASNLSYDDSIKLDFIAKRVLELSKAYNYNEEIVLNYMFSKPNETYYLSYSKPTLYRQYIHQTKPEEINLINKKEKVLIITAFDTNRKHENILKLVDYSLRNLEKIKRLKVDTIKHEYYYIQTIDTIKINTEVNKKSYSEKVKNVLNTKLYREVDNKKYTCQISYFTKNDLYFPYYRKIQYIGNIEEETVLDTLDSFLYYAEENNNVFIFKDKKTFNCYLKPGYGLMDSLIIHRDVEIYKDTSVYYRNVSVKELMVGVYILNFWSLYMCEESAIFSAKYGLVEESLGKYKFNLYEEYLNKNK